MERIPGYDAWKLASPPSREWPDDEVREYRCHKCGTVRAIVTRYVEDAYGDACPVEDGDEVDTVHEEPRGGTPGRCLCRYCADAEIDAYVSRVEGDRWDGDL